ncbi:MULTISPECIES: glyoxalase superfamily protein [unclassified Rathayibacter]|uniref:glyoxalase superfamily protein n=1 Tax=unclassified Rathayibacter TaxID=2609250 RepID=UPI0021A49A22|nr:MULTISPECIES: glyoxalase superfamily protein [unclassified Rathayibacter]
METRRRARDHPTGGDVPRLEAVRLEAAVPILRIFSVAKAGEFYVDYLGFTVDWEHRASRDAPLYLQVSRSGLRLHLSEHHRDGSPGAAVHVALRGVRELHAELDSKEYPYLNPRITRSPFGFALDLIDPFGNQIRFAEAAPDSANA